MKIGIISDTHDNLSNLQVALKYFDDNDIKYAFHLGDFCAPSVVKEMLKHENIMWICVWGNVDGAKVEITELTKESQTFNITARSFREYETPDGLIFITHYPMLAEHAAETGKYIACFHGHTHEKRLKTMPNGTILGNPGEVTDIATGKPSFGIFDTESKTFEIIDIKNK